MASGYYGSGYHNAGFYDSGYYGEETEDAIILPGGGSASGPREDPRPKIDDEKVIMAVIKQFLIEVNRDI
jgi:hypothetical protein